MYFLLLFLNAPLLLMVVGTLTLPAFSVLALLLSSVKVCPYTLHAAEFSHCLCIGIWYISTFLALPLDTGTANYSCGGTCGRTL